MKFINLLFSIYIIVLSCMPCADEGTTIIENESAYSIQHKTNSRSNKHHDDSCSPFCICTCCHSNGFYKSVEYSTNHAVIKIYTDKNRIEYTPALFPNFHNSIWQPPQIS